MHDDSVPKEGPPIQNVVIGLLLYQRKIVIQQRNKYEQYSGKWELPGGKQEDDETLVEALRRELIEEVGVAANIADLKPVYKLPYYNNRSMLHFFYVGHCLRMPESKEGKQIKTVELSKIDKVDFLPSNLAFLQWAQANNPLLVF